MEFFRNNLDIDIKNKVVEINVALFLIMLFYISVSIAFLFNREYVDILNFGKQNIEIISKNNNIKGTLIYQSYDGFFIKPTEESKTEYFKKADIDKVIYLNYVKEDDNNLYDYLKSQLAE